MTIPDPPNDHDPRELKLSPADAQLTEGLKRLAAGDGHSRGWRIGARIRNAFLTGLLIAGPVAITLSLMWGTIHWIDEWVKPWLPSTYNPDTYTHFPIPGVGLLTAIVGLTLLGALAANLLGRTLVSSGELMLSRTPIVRNVYGAIKQIFESVIATEGQAPSFQTVGLIEFPSKGLWSLVFVTGKTSGEISDAKPGGEADLLTVFMPTGFVPPTGFVCFVPRKGVIFLSMTAEQAAKIVMSGGIVTPESQLKLTTAAPAAGDIARRS